MHKRFSSVRIWRAWHFITFLMGTLPNLSRKNSWISHRRQSCFDYSKLPHIIHNVIDSDQRSHSGSWGDEANRAWRAVLSTFRWVQHAQSHWNASSGSMTTMTGQNRHDGYHARLMRTTCPVIHDMISSDSVSLSVGRTLFTFSTMCMYNEVVAIWVGLAQSVKISASTFNSSFKSFLPKDRSTLHNPFGPHKNRTHPVFYQYFQSDASIPALWLQLLLQHSFILPGY